MTNHQDATQSETYLNYFTKVTVNGMTKMKCAFCPRKILSQDACKSHLQKRHYRAQRYAKKNKCETCLYQARSYKDLRLHCEKAHSIKLAEYVWTCDKCDFTTEDQKELHKHVNVEHGQQDPEGGRRFKCDLCSRSFSRRPYLEYHVKGVHDNVKDHVCDICGYSTSNPASLKTHIKVVHDNVQDKDKGKGKGKVKQQCPHCSFACSGKEYLKHHINVKHDKIKNFICELCAYATYNQGNFKRHKDLHLGIKDHLCTVCGEAFGQKVQLAFHMKKHRVTPGIAPKRPRKK